MAITANIGASDGAGGDNFSFVVATPSALVESGTPQWGRGTLIVESFSWADVERMLGRLLAQASGETWQEIAQTLNKELRWEFEGYRPD